MNQQIPGNRENECARRYASLMAQAISFTRQLGLTRRSGFAPTTRILGGEFSEILREWARINICSKQDEQIAGMCMQITRDLVEFLEGGGVPSIYTLGWMSYHDNPVYKFGPREIEQWLAHGIPDRSKIDVHAWVTLPSGEIVDPSWLSTVGIVRNRRELIGAVITADPEQSTSHQYYPVTVDTEILFALGMLKDNSIADIVRQAPPPAEIASVFV